MENRTEFRPVVINSRLGSFNGLANEWIAYFDRKDTRASRQVRHFIVLQESVKLMFEPWGWSNEWYVDVVRIDWDSPSQLRLTDLYLDVVVEGNGPRYRAIDLDDLGHALETGAIQPSEASFALSTLQRFLDTHLHRRHDFPPQCVHTLWTRAGPNLPTTPGAS